MVELPPPGRASQIGGVAEATAKTLAAAGLLALSTAFIYDVIFWTIFDRRILTFLVVADHIQTAVYAFAIIAVVAGGVFLLSYLLSLGVAQLPRVTRGNKHVHFGIDVAIAGVAGLLFVWIVNAKESGWLTLALFVVWTSIQFRNLFLPHVRLRNRVAVAVTLWLMMAGAVAYIDASSMIYLTGKTDIVTVETGKGPVWDYELNGKVLRYIDRGVVVLSDKRIVFVPKEHVMRIDQDVAQQEKTP